jgi:hypothetical protein
MRLATLDRDRWQLLSGEQAHHRNPLSFALPDRDERTNLQRGQAARLIFEIEVEGNHGEVELLAERMWVLVAEQIDEFYIGMLDNDPTVELAEDVYLCRGAEVPFAPEHVIEIGDPPKEYWLRTLATPASRVWPRE